MARVYRNNLSVLPLYDSLEEQLHRRPYSYGYIYPLYVHPEKLIPFFTCWTGSSAGVKVDRVDIFQVCNCGDKLLSSFDSGIVGDFNSDFSRDFFLGGNPADLLGVFRNTDQDFSTYSILFYPGDPGEMSWNLPPGQFYLEITLSDQKKFYSEVFTVVSESELSRLTKIEWRDGSNLLYEKGLIPYDRGYINTIYLDTEIGKPTYDFEEEGVDRDGYFFPEKQISKKTFNFRFIAPESLCDAFRIIGMSDTITVEDSSGRTYSPVSFEFEAEWLEDGILSDVKCEFNTHTVIKVTGKQKYI